MFKQLFKILLFIPIVILDGTLLTLLPFSNFFILSVALLILMVYREDPLFSKFKLVTAVLLGLFSAFPWYIFIALLIIWGTLVKHIASIMFAAKSVPSLIIFYFVSYGLFDCLFLIARIIQNFFIKEPFSWASFLYELKFAGIGLLIGGAVIALIYSAGNYFEKKFKSWFFIRRRDY